MLRLEFDDAGGKGWSAQRGVVLLLCLSWCGSLVFCETSKVVCSVGVVYLGIDVHIFLGGGGGESQRDEICRFTTIAVVVVESTSYHILRVYTSSCAA